MRTPADEETLIASLRSSTLLAVLRCQTAQEAIDAALALHASHTGPIEVTTTTSGWLDALTELRVRLGTSLLGVGTVLRERDALRAIDAGADFLVTPYPVPAVVSAAAEVGIATIVGAFTPAEIGAAAQHGLVKLFPACAVGTDYLRSVLTVMPEALVVPSGGIGLADVKQWLDAGALAIGVGSGLSAGTTGGRPERDEPRPL